MRHTWIRFYIWQPSSKKVRGAETKGRKPDEVFIGHIILIHYATDMIFHDSLRAIDISQKSSSHVVLHCELKESPVHQMLSGWMAKVAKSCVSFQELWFTSISLETGTRHSQIWSSLQPGCMWVPSWNQAWETQNPWRWRELPSSFMACCWPRLPHLVTSEIGIRLSLVKPLNHLLRR